MTPSSSSPHTHMDDEAADEVALNLGKEVAAIINRYAASDIDKEILFFAIENLIMNLLVHLDKRLKTDSGFIALMANIAMTVVQNRNKS